MSERKAAYMQITRKCNNECVFCSNPQFDKDYSLEEAKKQVISFKEENVTEIIITGGEPTTVDFLPELISFIKNNNMDLRIISNGVCLENVSLVESLYNSGLRDANISIHTSDSKEGEKLSGKPGHLEKGLKGIRNCINKGIRININCTINSVNCKSLSSSVSEFIRLFPEVRHYVFNNLDPGKSDGNIPSRAGCNSWIIARFTDMELELSKTASLLINNEKSFRMERVPLCFMNGFEEFSTETRKIVKEEKYICAFIEKDMDNEVRKVSPEELRMKVDACNNCMLNKVCGGVQKEYLDIHGSEEIHPVFKDPEKIKERVLNE